MYELLACFILGHWLPPPPPRFEINGETISTKTTPHSIVCLCDPILTSVISSPRPLLELILLMLYHRGRVRIISLTGTSCHVNLYYLMEQGGEDGREEPFSFSINQINNQQKSFFHLPEHFYSYSGMSVIRTPWD